MLAEILALIRPWKLNRVAAAKEHDRGDVRAKSVSAILVPEEHFRKVLSIERKRADRSERRFVLMLVHISKVLDAPGGQSLLEGIAGAVAASTRETDLSGWYNQGSVIGVLCTEIGTGDLTSILNALHSKVSAALRSRLEPEQTKGIPVSFQVFPDDFEIKKDADSTDVSVSPDLKPVWSNNSPRYAVPEYSAS